MIKADLVAAMAKSSGGSKVAAEKAAAERAAAEKAKLAAVSVAPVAPSSDALLKQAAALEEQDAEIAMASAPEEDGQMRAQPVFSLLKRELMESLVRFTQGGGRKIDAWTGQHRTVLVPFADAGAFRNANTLAELHKLEQSS